MKKIAWAFAAILFLSAGALTGIVLRTEKTADTKASAELLALRDLRGETVSWQSLYAQKPVLINFWATWCPPCVHEIPLLSKAAAKQNAVRFVGVSYEDTQTVVSFVAERDIAYEFLTTPSDIFDFFRDNGNPGGGLPYTVLINHRGEIIGKKTGYFATVAEIEQFITPQERQ